MTPHVSIKLLLTQSDDRLVRMAAAGHDRAFEAIVDRYRRQLLRYAERFPAAGPSEDVVQAAFVRAWGALRDGTEVRDLRPWLYRIVHNTALNAAKRQRGVDTELIESEALGVGPVEETEIQDDLRRTLDGIAALPGRQRDALVAVAVDGRAHADVGRELGITEPAVRQLVRRARANVRAVASALTPYPLIAWVAEMGTQTASVARIGELVGGAGGGALVVKLGAVAATTGALVAGGPAVHHAIRPHRAPARASVTRTQPATASPLAASAGHAAVRVSAAAPRRVATHHALHRSTATSGGGTSFSRSGGVPPGPSGRLHRSRSHAKQTPVVPPPAPVVETTVTPQPATTPVPVRQRHRGEHLNPADSAVTAGTEPVEQHRIGTPRPETSGDGRSGTGDGAAVEHPEGANKPSGGQPQGPQAPEPVEPHDGATGPSGSH